jgi:hypothetical protein
MNFSRAGVTRMKGYLTATSAANHFRYYIRTASPGPRASRMYTAPSVRTPGPVPPNGNFRSTQILLKESVVAIMENQACASNFCDVPEHAENELKAVGLSRLWGVRPN